MARHGSWNKTNKFGGDIAVVKLNRDGSVKSVEPFITGFIVDNKYIGRPVDVQPMKDGSHADLRRLRRRRLSRDLRQPAADREPLTTTQARPRAHHALGFLVF